MKIRDIENFVTFSSKYVNLIVFIFKILRDRSTIEQFCRQVHIVNHLKTNMLIDLNILKFEKINLLYDKFVIIIENCKKMTISIKIAFFNTQINNIVRVFANIVISFKFFVIIVTRFREITKLSRDRNFVFLLYNQIFNRFENEKKILNYIVDVNMCIVQVNNIIDQSIIIEKNSRFETIQNYVEKKCYIVLTKYNDLIASNFKKTSRFIKIFRAKVDVFEALVVFDVVSFKFIEIVTNINITIYDIFEIKIQLTLITKSYLLFWQNIDRIVDILKRK